MKQPSRVLCTLLVLYGSLLPAAYGQTCAGEGEAARPPAQTDDATKGYAVNDLWQACGQVWRAASVKAGAADWQAVQASGLPADSFGAHTVFAGGTTRMVSGYTGHALDVALTVRGQPISQTLDITVDGQLDTAPLGARDQGTFAVVTRVYDQSGHGNDLQAVPGKAVVHIGETQVNGLPALSWGEENGPGGFVLPAHTHVDSGSFFFGTTGAYASSNSGYAAYPVPLMLGQGGHEFKVYFGGYQLDGFVHVSDSANPDQRLNLVVTNASATFSVWAQAATYHVQSGNMRAAGRGRIDVPALQGGYIGFNADGGAWFSQGRNSGIWTGLVLADHVNNAAAVEQFRVASVRQGRQVPQIRNALVVLGDSRSEGFRVADGQNWPRLAQAYGQYQSYNLAVSGATTRHLVGMLPAAAQVAARSGNRVAVVFGGYNDHLDQNHIGYDETLANLHKIIQNLQAMKYYVVLVAEAPTDSVLRGKIMSALASGALPADATVDPFAPGHVLSNPANNQYWDKDFTHFTAQGQAELARQIWSSIRAGFAQHGHRE